MKNSFTATTLLFASLLATPIVAARSAHSPLSARERATLAAPESTVLNDLRGGAIPDRTGLANDERAALAFAQDNSTASLEQLRGGADDWTVVAVVLLVVLLVVILL